MVLSCSSSKCLPHFRCCCKLTANPHASPAADGRTPLHLAAATGQGDVATFLLQKGAWSESYDAGDNTPLHLAARQGHTAVIDALLRNGAKAKCENKQGLTPRAEALLSGHVEAARLLLGWGADLHERPHGYSLLHLAAGMGQLASVQLLLELGADANGGCPGLGCAGLPLGAGDCCVPQLDGIGLQSARNCGVTCLACLLAGQATNPATISHPGDSTIGLTCPLQTTATPRARPHCTARCWETASTVQRRCSARGRMPAWRMRTAGCLPTCPCRRWLFFSVSICFPGRRVNNQFAWLLLHCRASGWQPSCKRLPPPPAVAAAPGAPATRGLLAWQHPSRPRRPSER